MKQTPFTLAFAVRSFGFRVGVDYQTDAYGLALAWGYDAATAGPYASTHRHRLFWRWAGRKA